MCENMAQQKAITMDSFYRISYPEGSSNQFLEIFFFALFHAPSVDCCVNIGNDKTDLSKIFNKVYNHSGATHMDGFPDEIRDVVNNHWASFPPQHPLVVDLFGIFFLVLTFVSIFGNGLVIYIFLTTKCLRIPTNMFIINLAVSDVGIMLTQGPLMFINAFTSDFWMWGSMLCKIYGCLGGIFGKLYLDFSQIV